MSRPASGRSEAGPLLGTERNPNRETIGGRVAGVSAKSGHEFIPWQRHVADIAGEIDPATGGAWYRTVILQGLRQIGKTTLGRAQLTETCLFQPGSLVRYTAQNKTMAEQRLKEDFWRPLSESTLGQHLSQRVGRRAGTPGFNGKTGSNTINFANGSIWGVDAVKNDSGHGPALRKALIDEAFAHKDGAIEAAVVPAMSTFADAQMGIYSAAGDETSTYFRDRVDAAEARLKVQLELPIAQRTSRTAYFRFAAPADADRSDPSTWWDCHPALGWTITEGAVQAALENFQTEPEEFDRAYLGWWAKRQLKKWVIPRASWHDSAVDPAKVTWQGPIWGIDVAPERDWASIGYAATSTTGKPWVEVVDHEQGVRWVVRRLVQLRETFGGDIVALDRDGGAGSLERELEAEGFIVRALSSAEVVDACEDIHDSVVEQLVLHSSTDTDLDGALAGAVKIRVSDGSYRFGRGKSLADISPLYAVTLALYVHVQTLGDDYDVLQSFNRVRSS